MLTLPPPILTEQLIARFWRSVIKTDTCWLWSGNAERRGLFIIGRHSYIAARISFLIEHGVYPDNWVLHHCDVKGCVRPDHLFEGTPKDNSQDMMRKGRGGQHKFERVRGPRRQTKPFPISSGIDLIEEQLTKSKKPRTFRTG